MNLIEHSWHGPVLALCFETPDGFYRETRVPGSDVSDLPEDVRDEALTRWTPEAIDAFNAERAAPVLSPEEQAAAARLEAFPPLSPEQFHAMLNITGHRADIEAVLEAMSDPENEAYDPVFVGVARARLDYATHFNRDDPLIETMADMIGLTAEQVDDLWTAARNL